jgi:zinc transport system substrate-binding protein
MIVICEQSRHVRIRRRSALTGTAGLILAGVVAVGATMGLAGCSNQHTPNPDGIIRIVAGFYPLQFVAEQVGGPQVAVTSLTQPGVEPHDLELSPRQVASVADADLVIYLGGFQPAVDQATLQEAADRAFDVANTVPLRPAVAVDTKPGDNTDNATAKGDKDPHIWLDPMLLATVADALAGRLAAIDPGSAQTYRQRAQSLDQQLSTLDSEYQKGLASCVRRDIVVSHAAFGYLAQRYRLHQIPIAGLSPDAEPNPGRLADAAAQARAHHVTTIFFESLVSPKVANAVANEIGAITAVLDPIEGLAPGSTQTYLTVMRQNLSTLQTALGCSS